MPLYGKIVIIKRNGQDGTTFPLMAQLCLFGRDPSCDIRVQLANISKKHCAIVVGEDGKVSVNAYNRTLINEREVKGRADISHKDIMTIADRSFRFEYPPGSIFKVTPETPVKPTSSYLLGPSLETPKDETPPKPPASAGHTPRPKLIADSAKRKSVGASPKLKPPQNAQPKLKSPSPNSNKSPTASGAKKRKIIKSPQSAVVQRKSQRKNVSFGPYLSPEQFDLNMPVNTPVKKGGTTPRRVSEPPKYFGSPMVYSSNKGGKTSRKQSFTVTTIVEEEPAKSPAAKRKSKTQSPKSPRIPLKIKPPSPKSKTPSPKGKSIIGRVSLPRQFSPRISVSPPDSEKLYLSSSDSSVIDTPMKRKSDPINKTPPRASTSPKKSPKPLPKIPTPKSPDSKKIKALAAIHASKLKTKTPRLATSSLKKGINNQMFSEILKNGLAKKTPKVAKKLVKIAVGRKKNVVKKTPGRGPMRSLKVKTPHHVNSPETIVIKKKKSVVSGGKKKSLSISSFPTPSNITTDVFVSPLDAAAASTSKRGRNKGAMISRFIEDQAKKNNTKGKSRKSGPGYGDPSGIKRLVQTPVKIVRKSDSGLVKTAPKSPDYTNISGLKRLFESSPSGFDNEANGNKELKRRSTPGRSFERSSQVNAVLYRSLGSPKPSTSNDIKELLESSHRSLNEDEIAKLFGSPTSKPSTPKSNSSPKVYQGSSNRRKSGRVSETFVRPIGIATQIRNSPTSNLKPSPKGRAKSITPKSNSVSPKKSTVRQRSMSAKRRTVTRGLLEEIVTQVEDNISPRRNTRNSTIVSTPKNPKKSPSPKKRTPGQRESFASPSTSNTNPLTDSNAIPLPNISRIPISPLSSGNSVIVTQNSDPHAILEKAKVQEAGKLVVLYLVSPETLNSVVPSILSPSRGRSRSGAGASPTPVKTPTPVKSLSLLSPTRGRSRSGARATPTPVKTPSPVKSLSLLSPTRGRSRSGARATPTPVKTPSPAKSLSLLSSTRGRSKSGARATPTPVKTTTPAKSLSLSPTRGRSRSGARATPTPVKTPSPAKSLSLLSSTRGRSKSGARATPTPVKSPSPVKSLSLSPTRGRSRSGARATPTPAKSLSLLSPTRGRSRSGARATPTPVKSPSPVKSLSLLSPTRGRLRRGVNKSPKASPINKRGRRGRMVASKETTSTPIQQFESKETPTISPVAKDKSQGASPARKKMAVEESPKTTRSRETRANKTKSPSQSKSQRAIEDDLSSIKKSPSPKSRPLKGRQTRRRKADETESISIASPKAKSPSPLKRVTRGRVKMNEASLNSINTSINETRSPAKKTLVDTRGKKDISINASIASTSTFKEEPSTSAVKSQSPVTKKKATRGKRNNKNEIKSVPSPKSPSPVKRTRGKILASPRATPAKKSTRGNSKNKTDDDILLINSPKLDSPVKKTRGKATTLPEPKAPPSTKKVRRGKRKASPSPSPQKSSDEAPNSPSPIKKPTRSGRGKKVEVSSPKPSTPRKRGVADLGDPSPSKSNSPSLVKKGRGKRVAEEVPKSPKKARTTRGSTNYDEENVSTESEEDVIKQLKNETKPAKKTTKKSAAKKAPAKKKTTQTKKAVKKKTGLSPVREEKDFDTSKDEPAKKSTPSPKRRTTRRTRK